MNQVTGTILVGALAGAIAGIGTSALLDKEKSQDEYIKAFYATETAVMVSPHGLRKKMDKGDKSFILVDLRSPEEYEREHIIGAVNIPAYKDPETSAYGDVERIVNSFRTLVEENPGKEIIAYCYSIPCMTGRKIGNMLAGHGIFVKELGVGWNEWRHFWTLWNHEHEWDKTNVLDYISVGPEPGEPKIKNDSTSCPIEGEFGC
ncbi:MAG: rhodanese-like domain-containing protein [Parcubacteria group bacterium]|nr:rhodanese-like domain-containing protein [Parcubacteria group bacterium]